MQTYLDHNASSSLRPEARAAMAAAMDVTGNPSSIHAAGRAARALVEQAREQVAALVGARPQDVIFTGSGTEANNQAIASLRTRGLRVSSIEHEATLAADPEQPRWPAQRNGQVFPPASWPSEIGAVALMAANNETGVLQPLEPWRDAAKASQALLFVDAVQAAGKIDLADLGDLVSLSAHKLGGPAGVGALVVKPGLEVAAFIRGGGQERRRRAGSENLIGIAGFGAAAAASLAERQRGHWDAVQRWREALEARMRDAAPALTIAGFDAPRLPHTLCFYAAPAKAAALQLMHYDLAGIAVSSGAACSSGKVQPSHVLQAMGVSAQEAATAIRVSLGWNSQERDLDRFFDAWRGLLTSS